MLGGLAGLALLVFLVILFLRWRNSEEPEPVKEGGILVNGSKNGATVKAGDVSHDSGSNTNVAGKKSTSVKKVRVIG